MADGLRFRKARQADGALAFKPTQAVAGRRRRRQVDAAAAGPALVEDQRLLQLQAAVAGESGFRRRHHSTWRRAPT